MPLKPNYPPSYCATNACASRTVNTYKLLQVWGCYIHWLLEKTGQNIYLYQRVFRLIQFPCHSMCLRRLLNRNREFVFCLFHDCTPFVKTKVEICWSSKQMGHMIAFHCTFAPTAPRLNYSNKLKMREVRLSLNHWNKLKIWEVRLSLNRSNKVKMWEVRLSLNHSNKL